MRRAFLLMAVWAAALLPLVAGVRFVAARTEPWPPPAIAINPQAGRLANGVTQEHLTATVLERLGRLLSRPVRGHLDNFGRDRLRAWTWTYLARAAVQLHKMNHDPRLIEAVLAGADGYEAAGSQHQASDGFGWYTEDTRAGTAYREVPVTGLIIAPMVDLLLAARNDPKIAVLIESRRGKLLDLISRSIAGLDKSYVQPGANGYYLLPSGADVEPLNLMSVYARPLLGYWQLTGDAESLREVTGIARTWKSALSIRLDGTVSWPHTARPTGNTGPAEFLIKSSAAIEFPLAAFEAGLVLDKKDILALSHAPMTTLWTANEHGRIQVRETVDAASQSFLSATGADRSTALRPAAWYAYLCYDHTLKSALDAYLFSIDPRFTEHGEFAMFALANRLANEPVEGTCEIPNVPELQTASAR